jgi:hypothetical protein
VTGKELSWVTAGLPMLGAYYMLRKTQRRESTMIFWDRKEWVFGDRQKVRAFGTAHFYEDQHVLCIDLHAEAKIDIGDIERTASAKPPSPSRVLETFVAEEPQAIRRSIAEVDKWFAQIEGWAKEYGPSLVAEERK